MIYSKIKNHIKRIWNKNNIRIASRPGKTLLWIWVRNDMRFSKGLEVGIDAACGAMRNRHFFLTGKYFGIDINKKQLEKGKIKYPEALTIHSKIEDVNNIRGDFLLCVQTININTLFNPDNIYKVIKVFIEILNPGGYLIFNVGNKGADIRKLESEIDDLLNGEFKVINKKKYGAFHLKQHRTNLYISFMIAKLMNILPFLRTMFGKDYQKLYYFCQNKLSK